MKRYINIITSGFIAFVALTGVAATVSLTTESSVYARANIDDAKDGVTAVGGNKAGNRAGAFTNLLQSIINILLFIIGAIAVIMIIIGGIRYTISNGDQAQVTSAKNTILYAIVGLVIAIMAFAIVNWILDSLNR